VCSKVKPTFVLNATYFILETLDQLLWLFCHLKLKKVKLKPFVILFSIGIVVSVKKSKQTSLLKR